MLSHHDPFAFTPIYKLFWFMLVPDDCRRRVTLLYLARSGNLASIPVQPCTYPKFTVGNGQWRSL